MAKYTDVIRDAIIANFEAGDQPTAAQFTNWITRIQEGIEEHNHDGTGDGDGIAALGPLTSLTMAEDAWQGIAVGTERFVFNGGNGTIAAMDTHFAVGNLTPTSALGPKNILEVAYDGDGFPILNLERYNGVAKVDRKWSMYVGSTGNFVFQDATGALAVFEIEKGAPTASFIIKDTTGRIGFGGVTVPAGLVHARLTGAGDVIVAETDGANQNNLVCRTTHDSVNNATISYYLQNITPADTLYGQMSVDNVGRAAAGETGTYKFNVLVGGAWATRMAISTGLTVNNLAGVGNREVGADATGLLILFASDRKLKTEVEPITDALEVVCALRGVTFNWNKEALADVGLDFGDTERQAGLIAQEVVDVIPNARADGEKYQSYRRSMIMPYVIEAIKELDARLTRGGL